MAISVTHPDQLSLDYLVMIALCWCQTGLKLSCVDGLPQFRIPSTYLVCVQFITIFTDLCWSWFGLWRNAFYFR